MGSEMCIRDSANTGRSSSSLEEFAGCQRDRCSGTRFKRKYRGALENVASPLGLVALVQTLAIARKKTCRVDDIDIFYARGMVLVFEPTTWKRHRSGQYAPCDLHHVLCPCFGPSMTFRKQEVWTTRFKCVYQRFITLLKRDAARLRPFLVTVSIFRQPRL